MKIKKLPSDSYLIRKIYNEKMHTVIFDYEPTQKEVMQAMASELGKVQEKHSSMTFKSACDQYIEAKRNILSPSTIREHHTIIRQIPDAFLTENVHDITALDMQTEVNRLPFGSDCLLLLAFAKPPFRPFFLLASQRLTYLSLSLSIAMLKISKAIASAGLLSKSGLISSLP